MSIIKEALSSKIKTYVTYGATAIFGFIIANLIFDYLSSPPIIKPLNLPSVSDQSIPPPAVSNPVSTPILDPAPVSAHPVRNESPNGTHKKDRAMLVLNGIFLAKDSCYAIINNQIVKENDLIDGVTVMRITADEVEVEADAVQFKLSIKNNKHSF